VLNEIKMINLTENEFHRTVLKVSDLLLVEGNGNPEEIGRASIWGGEIENCVHQNHLIRVRPNISLVHPLFLLEYLNGPLGKSYFLTSGKSTSGLATISTSTVKNCPILVPPLPLQQEFAARVHEVREMEKLQARSRQRLDDLFQSLLHRAFAGEV
jgi:type I restriction enzyme S subunit